MDIVVYVVATIMAIGLFSFVVYGLAALQRMDRGRVDAKKDTEQMPLPHRLIIDGVEECASDDAGEFLRLAYQYLGDLEQEILKSRLKGVDDDQV